MNDQVVEEIEKLPVEEDNKASLVPEGTGKIAVSTQEKPNPEDLAAVFFKGQKPKLLALLANMSAKQMRRVFYNACAYPLVENYHLPRTKEERDLLYLAHEMVLNKTVMQLHFEMQKAEEAAKMGTQEEHSLVKESVLETISSTLETKEE